MVVHGIPGSYRVEEGDLISVDVGVTLEGFVADSAYTFAVGEIDEVALVLLPLRLVETQRPPLVLLEVLGAAPTAKCRDGVARERAEEDEVEGDRDEDGADREQHPLDDVVGTAHVVSRAPLAIAIATSDQPAFFGLV
jgi:hypothetical protein